MSTPSPSVPNPGAPQFRLGTTGLAYADWKGPFYPEKLPAPRWLSFYASRFTSVELNTTFHALPTRERIENWRRSVPAEFRFAVKVSKQVTHESTLRHAVEPMRAFIEAVRDFGTNLGPLLVQLPPWCGVEQAGDLRRFLAALPDDVRTVVEFRSADWLTTSTFQMLADHNVAYGGLDHVEHPEQARVEVTSNFVYVRLIGHHARYEKNDREMYDPTPALQQWHERIATALATERRVEEVWVLIGNDFAGHAPATLRRFAALVGQPLPSEIRQTSLFD